MEEQERLVARVAPRSGCEADAGRVHGHPIGLGRPVRERDDPHGQGPTRSPRGGREAAWRDPGWSRADRSTAAHSQVSR
jgi:hypothetical protein